MNPLERYFTTGLLKWNAQFNHRTMPWKGEKNPYKIWLSEIILQQTRVQQGLSYYQTFLSEFPDIHSLANANEEKIFKHWEGLGYYTRCKNLILTARHISKVLDGKFPSDYENILSLKGVGPYTAAAISSFAFNLPYAVLDGNVFRVLARFFGNYTPINSLAGKKEYGALAQKLIDKKKPGIYNQAIMDFGADICKPAAPLCSSCPLKKKCIAFQKGVVTELPVNERKVILKKRFFNYLIIEKDHSYYINKRSQKDIWQNLHEFYLVLNEKILNEQEFFALPEIKAIFRNVPYKSVATSEIYSQKLTHQTINAVFFHVKINLPPNLPDSFFLANHERHSELAFPKLIATYLREKKLSLNLL